jgi:hypothetical protein
LSALEPGLWTSACIIGVNDAGEDALHARKQGFNSCCYLWYSRFEVNRFLQVFGVFTALPNLPFLCTKVTRLSGHGSGIEPQENNSKALQVSNIRWLLFHQDRQVMASTVACRASSPQLGSWLDGRWKIPCVVPLVPFLDLSTSSLYRSQGSVMQSICRARPYRGRKKRGLV